MRELPPLARRLIALGIGLVGGIVAFNIGLPLPWMLGPMISTTIAALAHVPMKGPDKLRPIVIPIIGVMLGSSITPDFFAAIGSFATTLATLPLFLAVAASGSYAIYRRFGRYDPVTAFFASMPGGLNEMMLLGEASGGDERRIALAHAARILLVILFVGLFFGIVYGVRSNSAGAGWVALTDPSLLDVVLLTLCAILGIPFAKRLRLPAAPVFGPMILSGIVHLVGWVEIAPPNLLIIIAQIVIGTVIGTRFVGTRLRDIGTELGLALLATIVMLAVAIAFAWAVGLALGLPFSQTFLAFSPGGLTEMSLLTLTLGQDIAFVSIIHIARITLVIAIAPAVFARFRRGG